ncbi:MAG TPA: YfhO family protein [Thermomicrobiales bacterium]|nr:YfhO family protein [Thermomicrobiales bacterium]
MSRWPWPQRYRADIIGLCSFFACTLLVIWHRAVYDNWLTEFDIFSFFLPWFSLVGERVRDLDVPGWTEHFSSGTPVAGDPSAGWMYLPVMFAFSLFPPIVAFKVMVLLQMWIIGFSTYAFGRVLGFRPSAALMSTVAIAFGPFLYGMTHFATVAAQVSTWVPLALLAVELALRASSWLPRLAAWCLGGLAVSQMATAWMGQGLMTGLLITGGWVAYRAVISPPFDRVPIRRRLANALMTGPALLIVGVLFGAAGILPRFAINAQSSIPGGDYSLVVGGDYEEERHSAFTLLSEIFVDNVPNRAMSWNGTVIMLCVLAVVLARKQYGVPFFAVVVAVAGILTLGDTVVHRLLYLIPEFQPIHEHSPRRIIWMASIGPAMLAGAAVQVLPCWRGHRHAPWLIALAASIVAGAVIYLEVVGASVTWWVRGSAIATALLALVIVRPDLPWSRLRGPDAVRFAVIALIVLPLCVPVGRDIVRSILDPGPDGNYHQLLGTDPEMQEVLERYVSPTDPGTGAEFIQNQQRASPPFRIVGYAGRGYADQVERSYSARRTEPGVTAVLVNGRAFYLDLESIQGYNPTHLLTYVQYYDVMNGARQDYHWIDPFPTIFPESQLLNMLNVRYILVDGRIPESRHDFQLIAEERNLVYRDDEVVIYENTDAFPRAWIVHDVRPNNDGEGLALLANGSVDGRKVAFVDGPIPPVSQPKPSPATDSPGDLVEILEHGDDTMRARVTAPSQGLVVFSESYAEGWNAYVDGTQVDILRTNHALRGVPVSPGEHVIEMRYEPVELMVGVWTTAITSAGMVAVFGWSAVRWFRHASVAAVSRPGVERPDSSAVSPDTGPPPAPSPVRGKRRTASHLRT